MESNLDKQIKEEIVVLRKGLLVEGHTEDEIQTDLFFKTKNYISGCYVAILRSYCFLFAK